MTDTEDKYHYEVLLGATSSSLKDIRRNLNFTRGMLTVIAMSIGLTLGLVIINSIITANTLEEVKTQIADTRVLCD